jgi:hypothetical protein
LVAEGHTNREAAEHLNVSPKTIEKHRASLMHKLELKTATQLVLLAMQLGWVESEQVHFAAKPLALVRSNDIPTYDDSQGNYSAHRRRSSDTHSLAFKGSNLN